MRKFALLFVVLLIGGCHKGPTQPSTTTVSTADGQVPAVSVNKLIIQLTLGSTGTTYDVIVTSTGNNLKTALLLDPSVPGMSNTEWDGSILCWKDETGGS